MKDFIKFFIEVGKLKKIPRRGWILIGIKNPGTVADHTFRLAIMAWVLGRKKKLNSARIIKIVLVHDLCELYAGDVTPYDYDSILPEDKKKWPKLFDSWPRFSKLEKTKIFLKKHKKEQASLIKLVKELPLKIRKEILNLWLDYEHGLTREGRFVKQMNRLETLLQAFEYGKETKRRPFKSWWIGTEERIDDPFLIEFMLELADRFYPKDGKGRKKVGKSFHKKNNSKLDFLLKIGGLKQMVRSGWILREVKNGSTVAGDAFLLAIAIWLLNERKKLNLEKMLKMSLLYEICEVYAADKTPYEEILPKNKLEREKILERWPRFSKSVKKKRFIKDYKEEKKSLDLLTSGLPKDLKEEIICLWDDCKKRRTPEGNFVNQIYWVTMMMQALQYWKKDKNFSITGWVEQMAEFIDDPVALEYLNGLYKMFNLG